MNEKGYEAMGEDDVVLYSNRNVTLKEKSGVHLGCYYFPLGKGKVIPWDSIGCVEEKELRWFNTKTWGMAADLKVWWHYDSIFRECKRHKGLVLHAKERQWVSPGLTPDNLDEVRRIIEARISPHSSLDAKI